MNSDSQEIKCVICGLSLSEPHGIVFRGAFYLLDAHSECYETALQYMELTLISDLRSRQ